MQKLILILICVCGFSVYAIADETHKNLTSDAQIRNSLERLQALGISMDKSKNKIDTKKYLSLLEECSYKGNKYCTYELGDAYYSKKEYRRAFNYYRKGKSPVNGEKELRFGVMYTLGYGVLQNTDKAIFYYKKSANQGNAMSAYNLGILYASKAQNSNNSNILPYLKSMYAWLKVASALGQTQIIGPRKGEIADFLYGFEKIVSPKDINEANQLAKKICSSISTCNQ